MNYTLHQLQVFIKVCEKESVTKASEELFLSQPAVSIQLRKLQDQFPIALTEVIGRKLYITEFGKEIQKGAEKILNEVREIDYKANLHKGVLAGRLKISIVSTGKYVMPFFLKEFMDKNDAVDLSMDVTNKSQVIEDLERNNVDFSLVSVLPDKLKLNAIALLSNQLFLVGKPAVGAEKLSAMDIIKSKPLILREEGSATRKLMEEYLSTNRINTTKKIELTSNEAVKQAVIAGLGYSIMPLIGIKNQIKYGDLEIIPAVGLPIVTNWNLVWLKDKKVSPISQAYIDFINLHKESIVTSEFNWFESYALNN